MIRNFSSPGPITLFSSLQACEDLRERYQMHEYWRTMKWTGHSDYKAMRPYIDIAEKTKADAMKKIDDAWGM